MKEYLKKYWLYGLVSIGLAVAMFIPREAPEIDDVSSPTIVEEEETIKYIYVDLKGEVNNPGVYKLESDARLFQVINLAGGLTMEADSQGINMSILLGDQMSVYVPSVHDHLPIIITPIEDEVVDNLIDINRAGVSLFESLPGIGPATAQNIVDYRDENGYFDAIEDMMNVPNIGESTFESIKDLITVKE